jgi:hypothetical protein
MKHTLLLIIFLTLGICNAQVRKGKLKLSTTETVEATELALDSFKVTDPSGKPLFFKKPKMYRLKKGNKHGLVIQTDSGLIGTFDTLEVGSKGLRKRKARKPVSVPVNEREPVFPAGVELGHTLIQPNSAQFTGGGTPTVLYGIDYDKFVALGSNVQNCVNWITQLHTKSLECLQSVPAYVASGYTVKIKDIVIYTTADQSPLKMWPSNTSAYNLWNEMVVAWSDRWDVDHKILITTRRIGGLSGTGVLGNQLYAVGLVGSDNNDLTPALTYNNLYCLAHEALGHGLGGAHHCFDCRFNGNNTRADSTWANSPSSCGYITKGVTGGATVMSYGHLTAQGLNWSKGFHPENAKEITTYWNDNKRFVPLSNAPACTVSVGPWQTGWDGYDSRTYSVTPAGCRGILSQKLLRRTPVTNPPCNCGMSLGPCINGSQTVTFTATNSPCTGTCPASYQQACAITKKVSVKGVPYVKDATVFTLADTIKAVDGNTTTRFLSTGPTTVTWTFSAPVTINWIRLQSGYQGGSPNQTLTLTCDGVNVPLNFNKTIDFTGVINATGRVFRATTTGVSGISRVFEISLSK